MKSQFCYGAFGALILMVAIATHLWTTYASLFQDETAYIYNPQTTEMFEIEMTYSVSAIRFWNLLNPFASIRRREPGVGAYLGRLSELRDRVRQYNSTIDYNRFEPNGPTSLIVLEYFRTDGQDFDHAQLPPEWQGIITHANDGTYDVILANAVIIRQDWPSGYMGDGVWPVEVNLASNVVIFFGRSASELCVREVTRGSPKLEGVVRQVGCFFP